MIAKEWKSVEDDPPKHKGVYRVAYSLSKEWERALDLKGFYNGDTFRAGFYWEKEINPRFWFHDE